MSQINVLDSSIFNRIAAGEVVESPRSVVKELVENSIDAKSTAITVSVRGAGIDYIRVADNGSGISPDDMEKAILPHATSKIKTISDLEQISSLGFRGEALASICSVADVKIMSRISGSELGYYIVVSCGKIIEKGETGCSLGTVVEVSDLFKTVPARRKFLQSERVEEGKIRTLINSLILANPDISITYEVNDNVGIESHGDGIQSAINTVYGKTAFSNMTPILLNENGISISGYIGLPSYSKHSRAFQTLIVNGRTVVNNDISFMVYNAYAPYLMKRQYPVYVLYFQVPYDFVDVNVHPAKTEIKFSNIAMIKALTSVALKAAINSAATSPKELFNNAEPTEDLSVTLSDRLKPTTQIFETPKEQTLAFKSNAAFSEIFSSALETVRQERQANTQQTSFDIDDENCIYIGKLFNTYLMFERGDNLYIIDQHAAHEKILFDELMKECSTDNMVIQDLLMPYEFNLSPEEYILFESNQAVLKKCGFIIQPKSENTFTLLTIPHICSSIDMRCFVQDMLLIITTGSDTPKTLTENLMQAACKAAVKGNDDISKKDIESLIKQMIDLNVTLFCPHGRPIIVKVSRKEIEKWFKRIV